MRKELKSDRLRETIISDFNLLGLSFFKRTRLKECALIFNHKNDKDFFLGLYPLIKYHKLENNYISLNTQKNWDKTVSELFYKSLMHLALVGAIKIHFFNDNKNVLGVFNIKINGVYLKLNDTYLSEDIFLKLILKSIKAVNLKHIKEHNLKNYIEYLVEDFLGPSNNEYNNPEKKS